jgi:hypothetical protein
LLADQRDSPYQIVLLEQKPTRWVHQLTGLRVVNVQ